DRGDRRGRRGGGRAGAQGEEEVVTAEAVEPEVDDVEVRAEWTGAYINGLPDAAFAVVKAGGTKDDTGRTVPRDLRLLPHHDTSGAVDLPHVRNALARLSQADLPPSPMHTVPGHLTAHLDAQNRVDEAPIDEEVAPIPEARSLAFDPSIEVRDVAKREVDMRLLPWDTTIDTSLGPEVFRRGAFADARPENVFL